MIALSLCEQQHDSVRFIAAKMRAFLGALNGCLMSWGTVPADANWRGSALGFPILAAAIHCASTDAGYQPG